MRTYCSISSLDSLEALITLMSQQQQQDNPTTSSSPRPPSQTCRKIASRFLSRILLRHDGLHSLIETLVPAVVMDGSDGQQQHQSQSSQDSLISPQKLDVMARIVLTIPVN